MLDSCEFTEQTHGHASIVKSLLLCTASVSLSPPAVRQIELEITCNINDNNNNVMRRNGEFKFGI